MPIERTSSATTSHVLDISQPQIQTPQQPAGKIAQARVPDITVGHISIKHGGPGETRPDANRLSSVRRQDHTLAQKAAQDATREKPSLLRRLFAGVVGAVSGAVGGFAAGLLGTGALVGEMVKGGSTLGMALSLPVLAIGAALSVVAAVGGMVISAAHSASEGTFKAAILSAGVPVRIVMDLIHPEQTP